MDIGSWHGMRGTARCVLLLDDTRKYFSLNEIPYSSDAPRFSPWRP